jgi:hypothetical protein
MPHFIKTFLFFLFSLSLLACKKPSINTVTTNTSKSKTHSNNIAVAPETKPIKDTTTIILDKPEAFDSLAAFEQAYSDLEAMLQGKQRLDFKRAVFLTENAYYMGGLDYGLFCKAIDELKNKCTALSSQHLLEYSQPDSADVKKNAAVHKVLTSAKLVLKDSTLYLTRKYGYDFDDPKGKELYPHTFVSRLLSQKIGNCKSMSYLYKILATELQAKAWISIAPMHFYIKNRNKKQGFYNTELTTGEFPTDVEIANSGYISTEAMVNRLYMDTLSMQQSVAMCMQDLARASVRLFGYRHFAFTQQCVDKCLQYYPSYVFAHILKARMSKELYHQNTSPQNKEAMEKNYLHLLNLGYRPMPLQNYQNWLQSLEEGKRNQLQPLYGGR